MYDPLIMVMIKSTFLNLVNVLVRFNQLLWYFSSLPRIQYRHPPSHLLIKKKKKSAVSKTILFFISSALLWKWKSLMIFSLSCNYNNDMTYNWPNSAFFNFQKNANQENCRQYSCILFFSDKLEQRTWRRENLSLNRVFFHKLDNHHHRSAVEQTTTSFLQPQRSCANSDSFPGQ